MPLKRRDNLAFAFQRAPEHRAAAIDRPAIAIDPDDIDIRRALGFAFFKDFIAFVDHGIERALDDFLIADLTLGQVGRCAELFYDRKRLGTWRANALFIIIVKALAVFLTKTASRTQRIADSFNL